MPKQEILPRADNSPEKQLAHIVGEAFAQGVAKGGNVSINVHIDNSVNNYHTDNRKTVNYSKSITSRTHRPVGEFGRAQVPNKESLRNHNRKAAIALSYKEQAAEQDNAPMIETQSSEKNAGGFFFIVIFFFVFLVAITLFIRG